MSDEGIAVDVQYATSQPGVPDSGRLRVWARAALQGGRDRAELTVRIVDEPEGLELNRRWRGQDRPTNVLSFPFEAPPGAETDLLGDVVICAGVVEREAREGGLDAQAHWAHLVVHGVLHLLGYDHQDEGQARIMEGMEVDILRELGFENPYEE